ncbi:hypothetical protein RF55_9919 [Lasius niger]|uniref:Uncharacterized protein n=2 Tax=Lasius niger TaxID=67767 RepID=A0A0J7KJA7_LASNI|nr:hypothetical protein RF55_9919 [Lasius niger]
MGWEEDWLSELKGIRKGLSGIVEGMRGIERELRLLRERVWKAREEEEKEEDRLESGGEEAATEEEAVGADAESEEKGRKKEDAERRKKGEGGEEKRGRRVSRGSKGEREESEGASDKRIGKMIRKEAGENKDEESKEGGEWKEQTRAGGMMEGMKVERRMGDKGAKGIRAERGMRGGEGEGKGEKGDKEEDRIAKGGKEGDSWWKSVEEEVAEEEEGETELWNKLEDRIERKRKKEGEREREREAREKLEEQVKRERRRRNLVWRGIEGDSFEERSRLLKLLIERILGRKVELRGVEERIKEGGKRLLLVIMEEKGDRDEILEKRGEIGRRWRMEVDEDLTREERKMKWRIKERARLERGRGKRVEFDSRGLWVEGREWKWDEEMEVWREVKEV